MIRDPMALYFSKEKELWIVDRKTGDLIKLVITEKLFKDLKDFIINFELNNE